MRFSELLHEVCAHHVPGLPAHVFSKPPSKLVGGNETTIYSIDFDVPEEHAFSGPLIIRIFDKAATHNEQYLWEAATQEVLGTVGYPVPQVLLAAEAESFGRFLIMEQLPGIMMGSDGLAMPIGVLRFPRIYRGLPGALAELHLELHGIDPAPLEQKLAGLESSAGMFTPAGRIGRIRDLAPSGWSNAQRACDRLLAELPETVDARICHGDLHPLNVMADKGRITGVIDWSKICFADREHDLANACLLLQASVLELPGWIAATVNALKRRMAGRFLDYYARRVPIDRAKLTYFKALRACEELVLAHEGFTPRMGEVGGWNMDLLDAVLVEQTGITLT